MMKRIALVGFGLLAGSIASALKQAKRPTVIRAVSSPATLARARELELADEFFEYAQVEEWSRDCDLILLCGPILHILKTIDALSQVEWAKEAALSNGASNGAACLVSDIGSTKVEICRAGSKLPAPFKFVGSHPMAGSEKRTCEYNDPAIFENAYWFVCPPEGTAESVYAPLLELVKFLGASAVVFPPEHHDRTMAWVSHMPQMLSSTLAASIPDRLLSHNYQHYAGRAFRDMTRIAASGWAMWHDIAVTNRDETVRALTEVRDGVNTTIEAMQKLDVVKDGRPAGGSFDATRGSVAGGKCADRSDSLEEIFKAGNEGRASLFAPGRNAAAAFFEITVPLKDKPGALLSVLQPLAEEGLNIRDIELMKVRENVAGTLLIAFKTEDEAARAVKLLRYLGYEVKER
ncbi:MULTISPECIES: prephenate dehydrogenase/arogenate dehydrogenase family protein [unclassified Fibrobacter]|uniref:prephenate dehydrogenase/arogenate dehydrogenase family protein n=1 Tax=unclassified Fibrobacter TaxID=2634177 RepID=UPI0025BD2E44|nr:MULTISPECIES: prephenate dehydrogenase/arogenate dehydrogenase family protein [unclassified Fibrobacter]MBR4614323.1 prephenate dehydrogenase/arogenate dehydrogenase family protein [Kiritimatiellia bacterium]